MWIKLLTQKAKKNTAHEYKNLKWKQGILQRMAYKSKLSTHGI